MENNLINTVIELESTLKNYVDCCGKFMSAMMNDIEGGCKVLGKLPPTPKLIIAEKEYDIADVHINESSIHIGLDKEEKSANDRMPVIVMVKDKITLIEKNNATNGKLNFKVNMDSIFDVADIEITPFTKEQIAWMDANCSKEEK